MSIELKNEQTKMETKCYLIKFNLTLYWKSFPPLQLIPILHIQNYTFNYNQNQCHFMSTATLINLYDLANMEKYSGKLKQ